jgi:hypothetical protein
MNFPSHRPHETSLPPWSCGRAHSDILLATNETGHTRGAYCIKTALRPLTNPRPPRLRWARQALDLVKSEAPQRLGSAWLTSSPLGLPRSDGPSESSPLDARQGCIPVVKPKIPLT